MIRLNNICSVSFFTTICLCWPVFLFSFEELPVQYKNTFSTYHFFCAVVTHWSSALYPLAQHCWSSASSENHAYYIDMIAHSENFLYFCGYYAVSILSEWHGGHVIKIFSYPPSFFSFFFFSHLHADWGLLFNFRWELNVILWLRAQAMEQV